MSNTEGDATLADKAFDMAGKAAKGVASGFKKATNAAADKFVILLLADVCRISTASGSTLIKVMLLWRHCPWSPPHSDLSDRYADKDDRDERHHVLYDGVLHVCFVSSW